MQAHKWVDGLFDNAKVFPYTSEMPENTYVYDFTKPVFIRNDTLCFFYEASSLKIYGRGYIEGELAVYKKVNHKWIKWITVFTMIS